MGKNFFQSLLGSDKNVPTPAPEPAPAPDPEPEPEPSQDKTEHQEPWRTWPSEPEVVVLPQHVERHPLMPSESDYERHRDALSKIEALLADWSHTFREASKILTEGWMPSPATGTYINGSMLIEMPILGRSGSPVAGYELWIVHRKTNGYRYEEPFELREYWACQLIGPKTASWKDLQRQPLAYDVVAPQIYKLFEIATRLENRPDWLAEVILATIKKHYRGFIGKHQREAANALSLEYLGKKFLEEPAKLVEPPSSQGALIEELPPPKKIRAAEAKGGYEGIAIPEVAPSRKKRKHKGIVLPEVSSSSDPEDKFYHQVQATIQALQAKGVQPYTITDDSRTTITGWTFEVTKNWGEDKDYNYSYDSGRFEETHGQDSIILTVDGEFYYHSQYHESKKAGHGAAVEEHSVNTLARRDASSFVGQAGEPYSKAITQLKRLAY